MKKTLGLITFLMLVAYSVYAQFIPAPQPFYTNSGHTVLYMGTPPPGFNTYTPTITSTPTNSPTNTPTITPTFTPTPVQIVFSSQGIVGATSGWVVNAANNLGILATLPASQTGSTLKFPISGLFAGDVVSVFSINGNLASGGNGVTLTSDLRQFVTGNDSSVGSYSVTLSSTSNLGIPTGAVTFGTPLTITGSSSYYALLTCSNGASTAVTINGAVLVVKRPRY